MSAILSVADALEIQALPVYAREQMMRLVQSAYLAGYDDAAEIAVEDARDEMHGLACVAVREASVGLWLVDNACPVLGVDLPEGLLR